MPVPLFHTPSWHQHICYYGICSLQLPWLIMTTEIQICSLWVELTQRTHHMVRKQIDYIRLERWHSGQEQIALPEDWVQVPTPTWQLTTGCNSRIYTLMQQTYQQAKHHIYNFLKPNRPFRCGGWVVVTENYRCVPLLYVHNSCHFPCEKLIFSYHFCL